MNMQNCIARVQQWYIYSSHDHIFSVAHATYMLHCTALYRDVWYTGTGKVPVYIISQTLRYHNFAQFSYAAVPKCICRWQCFPNCCTTGKCDNRTTRWIKQIKLHVTADHPELHHVTANHPESHRVTADHPESHRITADHPESRHSWSARVTSQLICQSHVTSQLITQSHVKSRLITQSQVTSRLITQSHVSADHSESLSDIQGKFISILVWHPVWGMHCWCLHAQLASPNPLTLALLSLNWFPCL